MPPTPLPPPPPQRRPKLPQGPPPSGPSLVWLWVVAIGVALVFLPLLLNTTSGGESLTFTDLMTRVDNGDVAKVTIDPDGRVTGELRDGTKIKSQIPVAAAGQGLADRFAAKDVAVTGKGPASSWWAAIFAFGPVILIVVAIIWFSRRAAASGGGLGGFGRSKPNVIAEQRPAVRFDDVAGYDGVKQELGEILDFLRNPEKFARVGAKGPTGVLMLGPPGTGKTLFARALAGEASVPFLSVTGSAFVELFVGIGAARVRDLFAQARRLAPAIVFIDEIDAVGQKRGARAFSTNDEREQTVNQLLAEMDGFDPSSGVVVVAATNRPDVLDTALLRPGRFDRQVVIPLPNRDERAAILRVHCKSKPLDADVDLPEVARSTPGFSGADLANLANEAAITAVRSGRDHILRADFMAAHDRVVLGRRDGSTILLPDERSAVAAHEAGHALVAALSPGADPVSKVTILPSGPALGATQQLPLDDRHLYSESYLQTALAVLLGGRAGELLAIGEVSSGAADDLAKATILATRMVRELGMSAEIGPVGYASGHSYIESDGFDVKPYSDSTQRAVDIEVSRILRAAQDRAVTLLTEHREALERVMAALRAEEIIEGERLYLLAGQDAPETPDTTASQRAASATLALQP